MSAFGRIVKPGLQCPLYSGKVDMVVRHSFVDAKRSKNRREKLLCVVKYDADCVTRPASNTAYAVSEIDAICAPRTLNGPIVYCEGHPITLPQWDYFGTTLHSWTLLR